VKIKKRNLIADSSLNQEELGERGLGIGQPNAYVCRRDNAETYFAWIR